MKVLQVSKFYPPDHGGIEAVARDLSAGFVRAGLQVEVLCAHKRRPNAEEVDSLGVRVTRAGSFGMLMSTSMAPGLVSELRRRRDGYDIVHVHMPDPLAALAVWVARPRGRVVLHWHSDVVRQRVARHAYEPLQRWLLRRADAVIATSPPYAASSPWLRLVREKVVVIPIGAPVPGEPTARRLERIRQRHAGRRIVFALGRMTYYKGWDLLVKVVPMLPPDVDIVIGGGGPDLGRYRALAEQAGVADRVQFVGPLSADSVEAYFRLAELFCMASTVRAEAYGVAVLEAMARGVPVVASDIPGSGIGWLHRHEVSGLQVPPGDVPALGAALNRLLADPALRVRCGQAGRERWARHFSAETMADQTIALYRRLLAGRAPAEAPEP
ncbi:glycosyltransferase [Rubrivivax albus]|uniref:Glycosyltransferase n=1 Tax=Rubrivivax albus TaxID=2499835 RepID=A0A437JRH1_9BURK|nr:glycosyltransferase [Rubrivivax albus]RVT49486.1 glycosyltransferase [Rubrivivax albus]